MKTQKKKNKLKPHQEEAIKRIIAGLRKVRKNLRTALGGDGLIKFQPHTRSTAHLQALLADDDEPTNGKRHTTLMQDGAVAMRDHVAKMNRAQEFGTDLLHLFNRRMVDHVRQTAPNTYVPVFLPKMATHILKGTLWNKDAKKNEIMEHGYALAVVAVPIKPRVRQTSLVIRKAIPKGAPVYRHVGELRGKRGVLRWMVEATKAKVHLRALVKYNDTECDELYERLKRASLRKKLDL